MTDNNDNKDIILTIILKPNGNVGVTGPLNNKILSLGMIEVAKDLVLKLKVSPTIIPVKDIGQFKTN